MYEVYGHRLSKAQGTRLIQHHNPGLELVHIRAGDLWWEVEGKPEHVGPGTLFFTLPWQQHGAHAQSVPLGLEMSWLVVPASGESGSWHFAEELGFGFTAAELERVYAAFASERHAFPAGARFGPALLAAIEAVDNEDVLVQRARVQALIVEAMLVVENPAPAAVDPTLQRVQDWIDQVREDPIRPLGDIEAMAASCQLARSRFAELVKQQTGDTPARFHTRQRIHHAAQLLTQTKRSITDIAFSCEFATTQHFARVFARYMGASPSAFRQQA